MKTMIIMIIFRKCEEVREKIVLETMKTMIIMIIMIIFRMCEEVREGIVLKTMKKMIILIIMIIMIIMIIFRKF